MKYEVFDTVTGRVVQRTKSELKAHQAAFNWTTAQRDITGHKHAYRAFDGVSDYKRRSHRKNRE